MRNLIYTILVILIATESKALVGPALKSITVSQGQSVEFYNVCDQMSFSLSKSSNRKAQNFNLTINDFNYTQLPGFSVTESGSQGCAKSFQVDSSVTPGVYKIEANIFTTQTITCESIKVREDDFQIKYDYTITVVPPVVVTPEASPTPDPHHQTTAEPSPTPDPHHHH